MSYRFGASRGSLWYTFLADFWSLRTFSKDDATLTAARYSSERCDRPRRVLPFASDLMGARRKLPCTPAILIRKGLRFSRVASLLQFASNSKTTVPVGLTGPPLHNLTKRFPKDHTSGSGPERTIADRPLNLFSVRVVTNFPARTCIAVSVTFRTGVRAESFQLGRKLGLERGLLNHVAALRQPDALATASRA